MSNPSPAQYGMPNRQSPFVEKTTGQLTIPWYNLLQGLFSKTGGSNSNTTDLVYLQQDNANPAALNIFNTSGQQIGQIVSEGSIGLPPVVENVNTNPFLFKSPASGTLVVFSGKVDLSRDGVTFFPVSLQGGAIPVLAGDVVRVTWFGAVAPAVTFFGA